MWKWSIILKLIGWLYVKSYLLLLNEISWILPVSFVLQRLKPRCWNLICFAFDNVIKSDDEFDWMTTKLLSKAADSKVIVLVDELPEILGMVKLEA